MEPAEVIKELEKTLDRLKRSQSLAKVGNWEFDPKTNKVWWSDEIYEILGIEDLSVAPDFDLVLEMTHPDDREKVRDATHEAIANKTTYDIEHRLHRGDGILIFVHERGENVFDGNGKFLRMDGTVQDITEARLAQRALQKSHDELEQKVEHRTRDLAAQTKLLQRAEKSAHVGHFRRPLAAGQIYWSDEIYRIFGVDKDKFIPAPESALAFLHPDDAPRYLELLGAAATNGDGLETEVRIVRPDGEIRHLHAELGTEVSDSGEQIAVFGVLKDVTEAKKAEAELRQREAELSTVTKLSPVGIYRSKRDGAPDYINQKGLDIIGVGSVNDLSGDKWIGHLHPDDRKGMFAAWLAAYDGGRPFEYEYRYLDHQGSETWVLSQATPEFDKNGIVGHFVGSLTDITEQKRTEHTLRQQAAIIDQIHESVVLADMDGYINGWNLGAERLFGHSKDEALGKHFSILYEEEELENNQGDLKELLLENRNYEIEARLKRQSGKSFDGQIHLSLIRDPDGVPTGIVGYSLDVTDRKAAAEALEKEKHQTEEARRLLDDAVESFTDGFVLYDPDDRFLLCNSAYRDDFAMVDAYLQPGVPFKEFVRVLYGTEALVPAELNNEKAIGQRLAAHKNPDAGPWQMKMSSGQWVQVHEYNTRDGGTALIRRDITEQVKAERALTESEERFRNYTEATSDWFWEIGIDGTTKFVSEGFRKISGQGPEEVIGKSFFESAKFFQVTAEPEEWNNFISRTSKGEPFQDLVFSFVNTKSEKLFLQSGGIPVFDQVSGKLVAYRGTAKDITLQVAAERALVESEERFALAMRGANDGLWDWDLETGKVYLSPRWSEMLGYESSELPDTNEIFDKLLHPDDRRRVDKGIVECLNDETKNYDLEIRLRHKNGHYVDISSRAFVVRGNDGNPVRIVGTHTDISRRKQAEAALHESEETFRAITENTTDIVVVVDRDGIYKYIGPSTARVVGMSATEAQENIGKPMNEVLHSEEAEIILRKIREAWEQPGKTILLPEFRTTFSSGLSLYMEGLFTALPDVPGIDGVVVNCRDITARKKAEFELLVAKEEAEYANQAKSQFLSSMNHELRTPMNSILGFTQLLEQSPKEPLTENQAVFVREILKSGRHMLELIGNVLDLAKIESGDVALEMKVQNPRPLIEDTLTMIKASAAQRNITVRALFPESELSPVNIDALRFRQILLNLLSNAVKYNCPEGKVTLECATDGNDLLHISVADTGKGIPDEMRDKVFEPFHRLGAESSDIVGTGIGLTVTKQLVESMGGAIGFESVVDEGTTFWVNLPVALAEPQPAT